MAIISPIGDIKSIVGDNIPDWGLGTSNSAKTESEKKIPNSQLDKISPIGNLKYPVGDIIHNWVFSSVSPLINCNYEFQI